MDKLLAFYFITFSVALIAMMFHQHRRGTCDLFSIRNVFLAGFIHFQFVSVSISLLTGDWGRSPTRDPVGTSVEFGFWSTAFVVLFLLSYRRMGFTGRFWSVFSVPVLAESNGKFWGLAIAFTVASVVCKFLFGPIPLLGVLTGYAAIGLSAVATGLAAWVWARRPLNPLNAAFLIGTLGISLLIMLPGTFGRRPLVAIFGAMIWAIYFVRWRSLPGTKVALNIAAIAVVPVLIVALFTAARAPLERERSAAEHLEAMKYGNIWEGLIGLGLGQTIAANSIWIMENYPENFPYRPLMTIEYAFVYPVPRNLWENKPEPLSITLPINMMLTGVHRGALTLGPGLSGHIAAEGGWYALIIYSLFFALFCRWMDEGIRRYGGGAAVLFFGCALSYIYGIPRGESSVFFTNTILIFGGTTFVAWPIIKLLGAGPRKTL